MGENIQDNSIKEEEIGVREIKIDNRKVLNLLNERSKYAGKQLKVVKELKKLQEEYNELQKTISKFNEEITDEIYNNYWNFIGEFEDIYEVRLVRGKVILRLKDAVEEIKKLAKDKFLVNKLKWEAKQKAPPTNNDAVQ